MNKLLIAFVALAVSGCPKEPSNSGTPISDQAKQEQTAVETKPAPVEQKQMSEPVPSEEGAAWSRYSAMDLPDLERRIEPAGFTLWQANYEELMRNARDSETPMPLPMGEKIVMFQLEDSGTMPEAMKEKYPNIISLKGRSVTGDIQARVDFNDVGLLVEFDSGEKTYLSPLLKGSKTYYAYYKEEAIKSQPRDKTFE